MNPYRKLAAALVTDAVHSVRRKDPPRYHGEHDVDYRKRVARTMAQKHNDVRWFENPERSARWIEAAGLDWEAVVDRLSREGLIQPRAQASVA